jgi:glycosyltransferase involved in cell wall biosynthesis
LRVLIVSQYFWPEAFRVNDLALGLQALGHEVTVLTGIPNYPTGKFFEGYGLFRRRREDFSGVKVIRVPLIPRGNGSGWRLALNYLSFAFLASVLAPLYCRGEYDLILVYQLSPVTVGLPAMILKSLKRAPMAFWIQDLWPESLSATGAVHNRLALEMVGKLVRFIYAACDLILVQSMGFVPKVQEMAVEPERIRYCPNWAEDLYQPVSPDGTFGREVEELAPGFRVMFAGNIGVAQDFGTILAAAERLRSYEDIHWLILGDGRMRAWADEEVKRRGLTGVIHFLGRHPVEEMPSYFALADVMLATLKREPIFALTVPCKVQSYLACGRPVIAALEGEGARIVAEAGGLACAPEDPDALAQAILELYRLPAGERDQLGRRGRAYYETHFEREVLLHQLESWMKALREGVSA